MLSWEVQVEVDCPFQNPLVQKQPYVLLVYAQQFGVRFPATK
jgi:hypothetical protein